MYVDAVGELRNVAVIAGHCHDNEHDVHLLRVLIL